MEVADTSFKVELSVLFNPKVNQHDKIFAKETLLRMHAFRYNPWQARIHP